MGSGESFLRKENIPTDISNKQVEDGTIFYRQRRKRLYVKWQGKEVDASLEHGIEGWSVDGNAIMFIANDKLYSAVFSPQEGIVVTWKRDLEKHRGISGRCVGFGEKLSRSHFEDSRFDVIIHRGREIRGYVITDYILTAPFVSHLWNDNDIILRIPPRHWSIYSQDSSPLIYITVTRNMSWSRDNVARTCLHVLNTETMEFLTPFLLPITGFHSIIITGVHKDVITVNAMEEGWTGTFHNLIHIQLPKIDNGKDFKSEFYSRFKPLKVIGQGSFGVVFEARCLVDKWNFAVKRIPVRGSDEGVRDALEALRRLEYIGRVVGFNSIWIEKPPKNWQKGMDAELLPNLGYKEIQTYNEGCAFIYIQMKLYKKNLHQWLRDNKSRDITKAKKWFKQLVSAVCDIHDDSKLIHGGLKPSNIMIDENGNLKLSDIRFPELMDVLDMNSEVPGAPLYMAPEQFDGDYTAKVDIYSLGLILAELCVYMTVEKTCEALTLYQRGKPTVILKHLPEMDGFVSWISNVDPKKRPTCREILKHPFLDIESESESSDDSD